MKKNKKIFLSLIIVAILIIVCIYLYLSNKKDNRYANKDLTYIEDCFQENINDYFEESNDLIENCTEEFINNYFDEIKEVSSDEEKENMLIAITPSKIESTYGAQNVIQAPNNQYVLQYESEEKKNEALSKLQDDKSIISAEENSCYTIDEITYNSWGIEQT